MRRLTLAAAFALTLALAGGASAAQLIDRNAVGVKLAVNGKGEAMAPHIESIGADGIYEVIDEVERPSG